MPGLTCDAIKRAVKKYETDLDDTAAQLLRRTTVSITEVCVVGAWGTIKPIRGLGLFRQYLLT
jgi:hypothetical protein